MVRLILYPLAWLVLLAVLWIVAPAQGHTDAELAEWQEDWEERWDAAFARLETRGVLPAMVMAELAEERYAMQVAHPCRSVIGTECPAVRSSDPQILSSSVNRGMGGNVEQWRGLVATYFPANQVDRALCIMSHESGGNPNARNPSSGAAGLFQVMPFWWDRYGGDRYDPARNVQVARKVWDQQGWNGWNPYKRGECR